MKGFWIILICCEAIFLERVRKNSEFFQNNRSSGRNINPGPPIYEEKGPLDCDVRWCQTLLSVPY